MKSFKLLLAIVFALAALTIPATSSTAAPPTPGLVEEQAISTNGANKLPSVAVGAGQVHVAWSSNSQAMLASRTDESGGSFGVIPLGNIGNNSTYFNAAVDVGSDGTVHAAWIEGGNLIKYRKRLPGQQTFTPEQIVTRFEDFANSLAITVKGSNEIFISWRHQGDNPAGYIRFAYSNNAGATWPMVKDVPLPTGTYAGKPYLAANANKAFLVWTGNDGAIHVGEWNGDNFPNTCISCARYGSRTDFFNPTIAVGPDSRPYVAWRSVGGGVYYGSRQDNGTWGLSNVFQHRDVTGPVSIAVDSRINVHLAWISRQSGNFDTWYAVQAPGEFFSNPIPVSRDGGAFKANVDMAVCAKPGHASAHIAWESFGGGQFIRYARAQANGIGLGGAEASSGGQDLEARTIPRNPIFFPLVLNIASPVQPVIPPPTC